jgi:hypothetical protein
MSRKLTVTTPTGVVTRRTDRTYTHVVYTRGYGDAAIDRITKGRIELVITNLEYSREQLAKGVAGRYAENITRYETLLSDNGSALRAEVARSWGQPGVVGWCGRLDLAQKLAAKAAKQGQVGIEIIAVNPE